MTLVRDLIPFNLLQTSPILKQPNKALGSSPPRALGLPLYEGDSILSEVLSVLGELLALLDEPVLRVGEALLETFFRRGEEGFSTVQLLREVGIVRLQLS